MERLSLFKMDNNIQPDFTGAYARIYEKATPESGTGKYYNEKKPTTQQLKAREKYSKIKDLTNKGKHKEASALYKEGAKYDNTKSPDYAKKKAALAKKHGGADKIKGHPQYEEVGKYRKWYEEYKEELSEGYVKKFEAWIDQLIEEGYDMERWADNIDELVETYINENNLWDSKESVYYALETYQFYDELDEELLQIVEDNLGEKTEDEIIDLMESGWHRRNPGKKHPLETGDSSKPSKSAGDVVLDAAKKSSDKEDRMYVAMRRVKDRQKGYSKEKSDAADRLHGEYTSRQSKIKKGASPKEAAAQSHGQFAGKGFNIKRGGRGRKGFHGPGTDRGTGNKAARRAGKEVRDTRKKKSDHSSGLKS